MPMLVTGDRKSTDGDGKLELYTSGWAESSGSGGEF